MVSVIIPAYKARRFLPECLEAIGIQTERPGAVYVVDDCSPEPVDDIVAEFTRKEPALPLHLVKHETNRGQAAGRNTGARMGDSEFLAFIDCDDVWAPDHLSSAIRTMERDKADLCFSRARIFSTTPGDMDFIEGPMTEAEESFDARALLRRCFIIMSSVVVRRELFESLGGFDESAEMRAVEDLDFFLRALERGARFAMVEEPTLFYRKHESSATGQPAKMAYQVGHVTALHAHRFGGNWFANQSLVSQTWWRGWNLGVRHRCPNRLLLWRALRSGIPVPWEIGRGLIRMTRALRAQGKQKAEVA